MAEPIMPAHCEECQCGGVCADDMCVERINGCMYGHPEPEPEPEPEPVEEAKEAGTGDGGEEESANDGDDKEEDMIRTESDQVVYTQRFNPSGESMTGTALPISSFDTNESHTRMNELESARGGEDGGKTLGMEYAVDEQGGGEGEEEEPIEMTEEELEEQRLIEEENERLRREEEEFQRQKVVDDARKADELAAYLTARGEYRQRCQEIAEWEARRGEYVHRILRRMEVFTWKEWHDDYRVLEKEVKELREFIAMTRTKSKLADASVEPVAAKTKTSAAATSSSAAGGNASAASEAN
jgi:hypothetical protein